MDATVELALLIAAVAVSGLNTLGIAWLLLRLRSRGITTGTANATFRTVLDQEPHVHKFAEKEFAKFGDHKFHCNVDHCGEPKPDDKE